VNARGAPQVPTLTWEPGPDRRGHRRRAPGCDDGRVSTPEDSGAVPADDSGAPPADDSGTVRALDRVMREVERHVASGGWDGPVRVFALVRTAAAIEAEPALAGQLPPETMIAARLDPDHLTAVEQEGLPPADDLESLLAGLSWPPTVHGAAVVVERVVLPSSAEAAMPADPQEAVAYLMAHPERQDVRLAAGALRDGPRWCVLRTRANDDDAAVAGGADLVPGLTGAVAATLL